MTTYRINSRRERRREARIRAWHRFVLAVGYAALLYSLGRGIVYLLVRLGGWA